MKRMVNGALLCLLTASFLGCAGQATDDETSGGADAITDTEASAPDRASFVGKWELRQNDPSAPSATIEIRSIKGTDVTFDLSAVAVSSGHAIDEEDVGAHAELEGSVATYEKGGCKLAMTLDPKKPSALEARRSGSCANAVDVTGHYDRSSR